MIESVPVEPNEKENRGAPLSTYAGLAISIVVHLLIFLLVGSMVIFEGKIPPVPFLGGVEEPEGFEMEEEMPLLEEQQLELETAIPESELLPPNETIDAAEVASSMDLIASATTSPSFTMPTGVGGPSLNTDSLINKSTGRKLPAGPSGSGGRGAKTLFGFTEAFDGSMEGTLVDFKQDNEGEPTGIGAGQYWGLVKEFAGRKSWDVSALNDYFLVGKKLYATHVYYPMMSADAAPTAFGVADKVQPSRWIIVYRGVCKAPRSGSYRFWGYADDVLIVRMAGKLVFDGSIHVAQRGQSELVEAEVHKNYPLGNGQAVVGEWFETAQGQTMTVEIILGEQPGGGFGAFLFIEEKGEKYDEDQWGRPILPLFHTVKTDLELKENRNFRNEPAFIYKGGLFGE